MSHKDHSYEDIINLSAIKILRGYKSISMKFLKIVLVFVAYFFGAVNTSAQDTTDKDELQVGIYIEDIFNIDYTSSTFEVVFWIWVNSKKEPFEIEKYIDITGSTDVNFALPYEAKLKNGYYHSERKVKAKILNQYMVKKFPFDIQQIKLKIEFIKSTAEGCIVKFDEQNSRLKPEYIDGWKSEKFNPKCKLIEDRYESNFGNAEIGSNPKYLGFEVTLNLQRKQWNIFAKLFVTLFIAFLLASSSILLPLEMSEEKFGLIVGSLFTSIGNKYITDEMLPMSSEFNLSDRLHLITFMFITILAVFAVIEQRYKIQMSKRSDFITFSIVFVSYFTLVGIFCML
jgi:hypothetical protein